MKIELDDETSRLLDQHLETLKFLGQATTADNVTSEALNAYLKEFRTEVLKRITVELDDEDRP